MKISSYFRFKTVKISFFILTIALLAFFYNCEGAFAQSIVRTDAWVSENQSYVQALIFSGNGKFACSIVDLKTTKLENFSGNYKRSEKSLTLSFAEEYGGQIFIYDFHWINENKFSLRTENEEFIFYLFSLPANNVSSGQYENINPTYPPPIANPFVTPTNYPPPTNPFAAPVTTPSATQTKKSEVCYTCHGTGSCIVCKGTGQYSLYGNSPSTCSACSGTGKCWHCHGTRKQ